MKKFLLLALLLLSACSKAPLSQPSKANSQSGTTFNGYGLHSFKWQAIKLADLDLYANLQRYLGGLFEISTVTEEQETVGTPVVSQSSTRLYTRTRLRLPGQKSSYLCDKNNGKWSCVATLHLSDQDIFQLQKNQQATRKKSQQKLKDREFIIDVTGQHSIVSKIKRLEVYNQGRPSPSSLDTAALARSFLQQIYVKIVGPVKVDGPENTDLSMEVYDQNGCLDGFNIQMILPSGRMVTGSIQHCNQFLTVIPRPIHAGDYSIPLILEFKGIFLGPIRAILSAEGSTDRLASGSFHNTIEAIGRSKGVDIHAELLAREQARKSWFLKAAKRKVKHTMPLKEIKRTLEVNGFLETEVKLVGEI